MSAQQRPAHLRTAVLDALGVRLNDEELEILAGRLRFDDTPALSQQAVAARIGCSQPHVSNLERGLMGKFSRAAERRREDAERAEKLHGAYEAMMAQAEVLRSELPPKQLKLRRRKKRVSAS